MGLFGKIKENLNSGGIDLTINAPDRVEKGQTSVTVQVVMTAGQDTRDIKSLTATIERQYVGEDTSSSSTYAVQEYKQPFTINAGQSLQMDFQLSLDPADIFGDTPGKQALGNLAGKLGKAYDRMNQRSYFHQIKVVADVDKIARNPLATKKIILDGLEEPIVNFKVEL